MSSPSQYLVDIKNKNNILLIKEYTTKNLEQIYSDVNYLQYNNHWEIKNNNYTNNYPPVILINNIVYLLDNSSHEITLANTNIVKIDISSNYINELNISLNYYIQFSNRMYNEKYDNMTNGEMLVGNSNFYHKDIFSHNNIMSFYIYTKNQNGQINQTIDSFKIKFS
tara:strand:- start:296 stop:796 length:501 start_codon:yes stop_codon:yes gene_type:complete